MGYCSGSGHPLQAPPPGAAKASLNAAAQLAAAAESAAGNSGEASKAQTSTSSNTSSHSGSSHNGESPGMAGVGVAAQVKTKPPTPIMAIRVNKKKASANPGRFLDKVRRAN